MIKIRIVTTPPSYANDNNRTESATTAKSNDDATTDATGQYDDCLYIQLNSTQYVAARVLL